MAGNNHFDHRLERMAQIAQQLQPTDDHAERPLRPVRPVPEQARHVRLFTLRSGGRHDFVLTDHYLTILTLHRIDTRSEICTSGVRYCYGCKIGAPKRTAGYIGAMAIGTRQPVVVCLTPHALGMLGTWATTMVDVHRLILRIWREGRSSRCKMGAMILGRCDQVMIPYEAHAEVVLGRVFNIERAEILVLGMHSKQFWLDKGRTGDEDGAAEGSVAP